MTVRRAGTILQRRDEKPLFRGRKRGCGIGHGRTDRVGPDQGPIGRIVGRESMFRPACVSAGGDVDGQPAERGFLVLGLHVVAGLAHGLDHLVEAHPVFAVAAQGE